MKLHQPEAIPAFTKAFDQWINQNPDGAAKLRQVGVKDDHIRGLRAGTCLENILFNYGTVIEQVTGLNINQLTFEDAKRKLWGDNDQLPNIDSHKKLISELKRIVEIRGAKFVAGPLNLHNDREPLKQWFAGKGWISPKRMRLILQVVHNERKPVGPIVEVKASAGLDKERFRRALGSGISVLHSNLNMLEALIANPEELVDGDWMHIIRIANRMLRIFGINETALRRLSHAETFGKKDSDVLLQIASAFAPRTKKGGK